MTDEVKTLTRCLQGCGIPVYREQTTLTGAPLPRLTWSIDLTEAQAGTVTLNCLFRNDDAGLMQAMDRLEAMFPLRGRTLRTEGGRLLRLTPVKADFLRDGSDPLIHGGRMTLRMGLYGREDAAWI